MSIKSLFEDIADAIREKSGSSDTYTPAEMQDAILDIPSGGGGYNWEKIGTLTAGSSIQHTIEISEPYFIIAKMIYNTIYPFFSIGNSVNGKTSRIIFNNNMSGVVYDASAGANNAFMQKSGNVWTIGNDSYLTGIYMYALSH